MLRKFGSRLHQASGPLALFLVLTGGVAYAANTIGSTDIINNQVYGADVRDDSLAGGGLGHVDLKPGSVRSSEVAAESLKGTDIDESSFNSTLRTPAFIRSGSESGTSQAPDIGGLPGYQGVVVRKINSTVQTAGSVVARTDTMRLIRTGDAAVLAIEWDANPGKVAYSCTSVELDGDTFNYSNDIDNPSSPSNLFVSTGTALRVWCIFGNSYNNGHFAIVELFRFPNDNYWVGTLTSTYNQ